MNEKIIEFLRSHELISVHGLEKKCGIPARNLRQAVDGKRNIPEKYHQPIVKELKKYGLKA